ncbi:MAG TPA: hypothetical protein VLV55_13245 [Rhizomicrobium sp.]|nr:hypothetical protein [Rhizomicrobium sp.]
MSAARTIGGISIGRAWTVLWTEWLFLFAIGVGLVWYLGEGLNTRSWIAYGLAALVLLSGPAVFLRLYSRGMKFGMAVFMGLFSIVNLAACAVIFLKVGH